MAEKTQLAQIEKSGAALEVLAPEDRVLAAQLRRFMPGGDKLTDAQAIAGAKLARARGLNPLAGECYVYAQGDQIIVLTKYDVLAAWARSIVPFGTRTRYLTADEIKEAGLQPGTVAARVYLMRDDSFPRKKFYRDNGYTEEESREMVETVGFAYVLANESVPKGRDRRWKAEKGATVDAIRKAYGEPNPEQLQRMREVVGAEPEDYPDIDIYTVEQSRALTAANMAARQHREEFEALTDEQKDERAIVAAAAIFGGFGDGVRDQIKPAASPIPAPVVIVPPEPEPAPDPVAPVDMRDPATVLDSIIGRDADIAASGDPVTLPTKSRQRIAAAIMNACDGGQGEAAELAQMLCGCQLREAPDTRVQAVFEWMQPDNMGFVSETVRAELAALRAVMHEPAQPRLDEAPPEF